MSASQNTFMPGLPVVTWGGTSAFVVQTGQSSAYCIDIQKSGLTAETVSSDLRELYPDATIMSEGSGCWTINQSVVLDEVTDSLLVGERPDHLVVRVRLEGERLRYVATLPPFKALNAAGSYSMLFTGLDTPARTDALRWVTRLELPEETFAPQGIAGSVIDSTDLLVSTGLRSRFVKVLFAGGISFFLPIWAVVLDLPAWAIIGSLVGGLAACAKITATGHLFAPRMNPVQRRRNLHIAVTVLFTLLSVDIIVQQKFGQRFAIYTLLLTGVLLVDWARRLRRHR